MLRLILLLELVGVTVAALPHIVFVLADDVGWANVGYNREFATGEVVTPNINSLVANGIQLDRHYVYKICAPSRSVLQTGRLAVHVNTQNIEPETFNPEDPVSGYAGIPLPMTGIAEKMRSAGYRTHMVGKWDVGMATPKHTPLGRGYESFLGYYHHANDYWNCGVSLLAIGLVNICNNQYTDLWNGAQPAFGLNGTDYEEVLLTTRSLDIIAAHDPAEPLFLVHSLHLLHTPLEVPQPFIDVVSFIDAPQRRLYAAMVLYMDGVVGTLVSALKGKKLWDNTLLVFASDNGGPIYFPSGANNYPLKGGKYSDWEGGIRAVAFVSGGFVPASRRGTVLQEYIHMADWYTTFCALAGVDPKDKRAQEAGLPPVDGHNVWPVISGATDKGPWDEIHISSQALISGHYKLVVGLQDMSGWTGQFYPNTTGQQPTFNDPPLPGPLQHTWTQDCGQGCLFDIFADPTEHNDLALEHPHLRDRLAARLAQLNQSIFNPDRGEPSVLACIQAEKYGGYYGPFLDLRGDTHDKSGNRGHHHP